MRQAYLCQKIMSGSRSSTGVSSKTAPTRCLWTANAFRHCKCQWEVSTIPCILPRLLMLPPDMHVMLSLLKLKQTKSWQAFKSLLESGEISTVALRPDQGREYLARTFRAMSGIHYLLLGTLLRRMESLSDWIEHFQGKRTSPSYADSTSR